MATTKNEVQLGVGSGATLEPITINYTGTPARPFVCNVIQPIGVQINNTLYTASGKWVEGFGDVGASVLKTLDGYTTIDFPDLVGVRNDVYLSISSSDTPTEIIMDALVVVGGKFGCGSMALLTTLDLSSLTTVGGDFSPNYMAALTTLNLSSLTTVGEGFYPGTMAALTTLNLSSLTTVGVDFYPGNMAALTSIVLTDIETIGGAIIMTTDIAALTTFTLGTGLLSVGGNVTITSPTLAEASVNNTLVRLAALDGTGGTTLYTGKVIDLSGNCAPPSATGLAARLTLIAATNTVSINGNFAITAADPSNPYTFTVAGDKTTIFVSGTTFVVAGSTGNNGTYTVVSSAYGAATVITVTGVVGSAVGDGTIGKITG
jgi:hypothetical protein